MRSMIDFLFPPFPLFSTTIGLNETIAKRIYGWKPVTISLLLLLID
jgi:hypothetical protein